MPLRVDLHPDVVWFVRNRCNGLEQAAFAQATARVRAEPLRFSESLADPAISRFMLRFYRFGNCLAVFEYDPARNRMRVLQCRRVRPPKRPAPQE